MTVEDDIFKLQNDMRELQLDFAEWKKMLKTIEQELKE